VELRRLVDSARLYREEGRALLQRKELDRVSQWQKENLPSAEWAQRYVTLDEWNAAETFIKHSTADVKQQQMREFEMEIARRRAEAQRAVATKMRRLALVAMVAAMAALLLLALTLVMWHTAQEQAKIANLLRLAAEEQTRVATAQRLANASSALIGKDLQVSLLLAVEAVKAAGSAKVRVAAAEQSLLDALGSNASRLFTQSGSKIYSVAFSWDVHWLVTGSSDGMTRLWDLTAKDPAANLVVLRGHTDAVTTVAMSPDNRWSRQRQDSATVGLEAKDPAANPMVLRVRGPSLRGHQPGYSLADDRPDITARLGFGRKDPAAPWCCVVTKARSLPYPR
jgi:hypothetical protein